MFFKEKHLEGLTPIAWAEMAELATRNSWSYARLEFPIAQDVMEPAKDGAYAGFYDDKVIRVKVLGKQMSTEAERWGLKVKDAGGDVSYIIAVSATRVTDQVIEVTFPISGILPGDHAKGQPALSVTYREGIRPDGTQPLDEVQLRPFKLNESARKP